MNISQHAIVRSQQRGISAECINMLIDFGTAKKRSGGALEYKLSKKDKLHLIKYHKYQIQLVNRSAKKAILVSSDNNHIITAYNVD